MKIDKPLVFHPFLFAIFPSIFLFSENLGHVFFYQILFPTGIIILVTCAVFLILRLRIKENNKIAIIISISLLLFFSYGHLHSIIYSWQINKFGVQLHIHRYLILAYVTIFIALVYLSLKTKKRLSRITNALNFSAIFLFLGPIINLGTYEFQNYDKVPDINNEKLPVSEINIQSASTYPDIYYIIPDGQASSKTLKKHFNYDDSDFTDYLIDKGFIIATESSSNYMLTGWSLSSSLGMDYLQMKNLKVDELGNSMDSDILNKQNYKVAKILKSFGYKYVHFSSGKSHTDHNMFADINIKLGPIDEFLMILIPTTVLKILDDKWHLLKSGLRERTLLTFNKLTELETIASPKFVFAHLGIPHPPFVFGSNGELVEYTEISMSEWAPKEAYLNQLIFTQKRLKEIVNKILEKSKNPPIIIIQSDHGPAITFF